MSWPPKFTKWFTPLGWDPASTAAIPQMWSCRENMPCTTPAPLSLCGLERNLIEVSSIAVGPSDAGRKEPPRLPGCHSGKLFDQFLPDHRRIPKGCYRRRKFLAKTSRTFDFTGARRLQICREPQLTSSCRADDCGLVRLWIAGNRQCRIDGQTFIYASIFIEDCQI